MPKSLENKSFNFFIIRYFTPIIFSLLIISYFLIGFYQINSNNVTTDEPSHLGASQSYTKGSGLNPEHPLAQKIINSSIFPVFFRDLEIKNQTSKFNQYERGVEIFTNDRISGQKILAYSRFTYLVFNSLILFWLLYFCWYLGKLNSVFGIFLGVLYVFSPSFYSHNFLITFDVGGSISALIFVLSCFVFIKDLFADEFFVKQKVSLEKQMETSNQKQGLQKFSLLKFCKQEFFDLFFYAKNYFSNLLGFIKELFKFKFNKDKFRSILLAKKSKDGFFYLQLFGLFAWLFLALNTKFSNLVLMVVFGIFWISSCLVLVFKKRLDILTRFLIYNFVGAFTIVLAIGLMYAFAFGSLPYKVQEQYIPTNSKDNQVLVKYLDWKKDLNQNNPKVLNALVPYFRYADGAVLTLSRSKDKQMPFLFGEYQDINYGDYISQVILFKENPALFILAIFSLVLLILDLILKLWKNREVIFSKKFNNLRSSKNKKIRSQLLLKILLVLILVLFPILYIFLSRNGKLIIGYRHFYPALIFFYAFVAWTCTLAFRSGFKNWEEFLINLRSTKKEDSIFTIKLQNLWQNLIIGFILLYVVFGFFGIPQSLSYVNFFWTKPKWELTDDSTINWGQKHNLAYKYLYDKGALTQENADRIAYSGFGYVLKPNDQLYLETGLKTNKINKNNYFKYNQIDLEKQTDIDYIIIDTVFFQNLKKDSRNNQMTKKNFEYLQSLDPEYQIDDIIFVYNLKK